MTTTTTNYGWTIPSDTDLVTNGASAMRTLGQGIDTSLVGLKGGTTGQILSKTSGTDMAFTWITNDVGDITAVTTTAPLQGGASSGAVALTVDAASTTAAGVVQLSDSTSTTSSVLAATPTAVKSAYDLANGAIAKTTVTTAGDIIYRNATVPTRLGIGTAGQVLTVNSGATAPQWATPASGGGMTLINTGGTAMSGSSSVSVSLSGTYTELKIYAVGFYQSSSSMLLLNFNGETANTNYQSNLVRYQIGSASSLDYAAAPFIGGFDSSTSSYNSMLSISVPYYRSSYNKVALFQTSNYASGGANSNVFGNLIWRNTAAITSIQIGCNAGSFSAGTIYVYGVN